MSPGDDGSAFDISSIAPDIDGRFLAGNGVARVAETLGQGRLPVLETTGLRISAPFARPHAIYGIGLNYRVHAAEAGMSIPDEPIVFSKAPNSLCGPRDDIVLPPGSDKGDWEAELGVVIGRRAASLPDPDEAIEHIAGYVAVNDVSERAWQLERGGQWLKGKSAPTFNPAGPYLVTPDEIDPRALRLRLAVNGELMQDGSTEDMIFNPAYIVWYLSQFVTLEPGDLINSGTPAGVGMGQSPPRFLRDGDVIELSITGLGSHRSRVRVGPHGQVGR
jgi:2-keto-4-pentenoate hydratase/2-oxohepta-3-ene-1,7-dioic acid hydratase in catechol pathway